MNIPAGKVLTDDEVFELVNKVCQATPGGWERDAFKALAKSHEALRNQVARLEGIIGEAHETLSKARSKP